MALSLQIFTPPLSISRNRIGGFHDCQYRPSNTNSPWPPNSGFYNIVPAAAGVICKRNYHTLTTALVGILEKDEALFNEGLAMQLNFYKGQARGEVKNTPQEFICDHAVALANLGLSRGLAVTVENPRMPQELLIKKLNDAASVNNGWC